MTKSSNSKKMLAVHSTKNYHHLPKYASPARAQSSYLVLVLTVIYNAAVHTMSEQSPERQDCEYHGLSISAICGDIVAGLGAAIGSWPPWLISCGFGCAQNPGTVLCPPIYVSGGTDEAMLMCGFEL
jgi:hypothetical protein